MKRVISLLILLAFTSCKGQPVNHIYNEIDSINTSSQVNTLLHKLLGEYHKSYVVTDTLSFVQGDFKKIATSINPMSWQKADFDNNGYTDLLVIAQDTEDAFSGGRCYVGCIMDSGMDKFCIKSLTGFFLNSAIAVVRTIDSLPAIIYCDYDKLNVYETGVKGDTSSEEAEKDTLIFKFGDFIKYNKHPIIHNIQDIKLETSGCFGKCPVFKLTIDKNCNGSYTAIRYNKNNKQQDIKGTFKTKISSDDYKPIEQLINYMAFEKLKERYTVNWTDDQTATLTITYDDGKTKVISDYGEQGTFGLRRLYELLYALRLNQNWH